MRSRWILVVAALTLAGCDAARPTRPQAAEGARDLLDAGDAGFVTTGGSAITIIANNFTQRWSFDAKNQSGAVTGQFEFQSDLFGDQLRAHGDILCFAVEGNRARLGAVVRTSNFLQPGTEMTWNVEDNGEGSGAPPDRASTFHSGAAGTANDFCVTTGTYLEMYDVQSGNVQVH